MRKTNTWWWRTLLVGGLGIGSVAVSAQEPARKGWVGRQVDKFLRDTLPPSRPRFLVYPTLAYAPETSLELGVSSLFLYHAKNNVAQNRLSEVNTFVFFTLRSQYGLALDNNLYGDADRWLLLGRIRFQRFPLLYYGIGPENSGREPAEVDATYLQVRQRVLGKIIPNLFGGLGVDFQRLSRVSFNQPDSDAYAVPPGAGGTSNLGLGPALVFDNRHNPLNVREGLYVELAALKYSPRWGSNFNFQQFLFDVRSYRPVGANRRQVLASQIYGSYTTGSTVPFHHLSLMGGEMLQRGFYAGRYRDQAYLAGQVEFRMLPFPFSKRFGGAVFASAGAVAPTPGELAWKNVQPTGGLGLRYLLFPKKDVFLRFDAGFTREGPGFYIFTGEAF
ncbi:MAG: BamA/TamA family outer membrane protein [Sphingobacteriaceae bacterium]|nr:BamA/TamA family outer membrane protein [Cytophagaceae bacterium]